MGPVMSGTESLRGCHACGRAQHVPELRPGERARCARCRAVLSDPAAALRRGRWTLCLSLSALALTPAALLLPVVRVERFGHEGETSIVAALTTLIADRSWVIATIVLVCSILVPITKLTALIALSLPRFRGGHALRATTFRLVEWTGRWGMLDVLLVALLVATLKLGDMVRVQAGPGAVTFAAFVLLSLLASAVFDPHAIWDDGSERSERPASRPSQSS